MNRPEEYGYAGLYQALKHKYKYTLSTNLPSVSRRSQFLALLCIFPELIFLHRQPRNTVFCFYRLFKSLVAVAFVSVLAFLDALSVCYCSVIFRQILEIINDHPSLVVKVAKFFARIQNIVVQKANLDICCQLNS